MKQLHKFYPHAIAIFTFIIISLIYFYPVLEGKKIAQSDIAQYTGMAKEQNDFRNAENAEPYWTNSAFGGMPTFQLGANYPHEYISSLDKILRFLPRPADYLFLYFFSFYLLLLVLKTDPLKAFFGALGFGFSTYMIIILGVGHNSKAHAIAYMPMVLAGIILVFQKRYVVGGLLTMFAVALELNANHLQMTYYLLFLILPIVLFYAYKFIKNKDEKQLLKCFGIFAIAGFLAIGTNATALMATSEYAKESTRSKSELKLDEDGKILESQNAMSNDYITQYSYGIFESFNLIAPRLLGGSGSEKLGENSSTYDFILKQGASDQEAKDFTASLPTYWGDQPGVSAPAYIGAVIFLLSILCLFADKRKIKYAFLAGAILSLLLSWGKNFELLTNFCINYLPLYNKFRAVSSIQVLLELAFPVLAIMGLQAYYNLEKEQKWNALWKTFSISFGTIVLLFISKSFFDFAGMNDGYYIQQYGEMGRPFIDALKEDRMTMYSADLLRSGVLMLSVAGILWFSIKEKLAQNTAVIIIGILMVGDLFFVDKNYLDAKSFVSASEVDKPFTATDADNQILKDTTNYRVFDVDGQMNSAKCSYFHHSIGGYSGVKPRRMQQLFDYQINKNNIEVLNMLNVKYILQTNEKGEEIPTQNPDISGNAWFVKNIREVTNADNEMKALSKFDSKNVAIVNKAEFPEFTKNTNFVKNTLATIRLINYKPNHLTYNSDNKNNGLAIFSEIYYKNGWNAYIDGKLTPHFRADYVLRALLVPAGKHIIEFKFEPEVVKTGSIIALLSFIAMMIFLIGGIYYEIKLSKNSHKN
ncbi:MAG: YfhO family protein [Flavobacterium sp.]|nr:YfhO family protein [Flavobacterium sp.]